MLSQEEKRILNDLCVGNFRLTRHARQRMDERKVDFDDIRKCARTVRFVYEVENGKYRVAGFDLEGDSLELVAIWDGETVIITVIGD